MDYFSINAMGVLSDIDWAVNCLEKLNIVALWCIAQFLSQFEIWIADPGK
jgi:hypothetical protein